MGMLTKEQLDQVWHEAGMKYNIWRFHEYLIDRGLLPYTNVNKFSNHIYDLLHKFFVLNMKEDKDGRQQFPSEADGE